MPVGVGHFHPATTAVGAAGPGDTIIVVASGVLQDHHQTDNFTAISLQTSFGLTEIPADADDVEMTVNGVEYTNGTEFSVTGTTATWNNLFSLQGGDEIILDYDFIATASVSDLAPDHHQTDNFFATDLQTAFTLSITPVDTDDVEMTINGIEYTNGTEFSVSGVIATWNNLFSLQSGDEIILDYDFETTSSASVVGDHHQTDNFVATDLQTAFTLSVTPVDADDVEMTVNGLEYTNGTDFSVSGTVIVWNNILFTLELEDKIIIDYDF